MKVVLEVTHIPQDFQHPRSYSMGTSPGSHLLSQSQLALINSWHRQVILWQVSYCTGAIV